MRARRPQRTKASALPWFDTGGPPRSPRRGRPALEPIVEDSRPIGERGPPLCGSLLKMKRHQRRFLPVFSRRYFAVEDGELRWFASRRSVLHRGAISLAAVQDVRRFEIERGVYSFQVVSERGAQRALFLRADSAGDAMRWIRGLQLHVDLARGVQRRSVRRSAEAGPPRASHELMRRVAAARAPAAAAAAVEEETGFSSTDEEASPPTPRARPLRESPLLRRASRDDRQDRDSPASSRTQSRLGDADREWLVEDEESSAVYRQSSPAVSARSGSAEGGSRRESAPKLTFAPPARRVNGWVVAPEAPPQDAVRAAVPAGMQPQVYLPGSPAW